MNVCNITTSCKQIENRKMTGNIQEYFINYYNTRFEGRLNLDRQSIGMKTYKNEKTYYTGCKSLLIWSVPPV